HGVMTIMLAEAAGSVSEILPSTGPASSLAWTTLSPESWSKRHTCFFPLAVPRSTEKLQAPCRFLLMARIVNALSLDRCDANKATFELSLVEARSLAPKCDFLPS